MALFGLTAVDVNVPDSMQPAAASSGGAGAPPPAANPAGDESEHSTSSSGHPTISSVPDLLQLTPHAAYLTELPSPAAIAAAAAASSTGPLPLGARGKGAAGTLAPMVTPGSAPAALLSRTLSGLGSSSSYRLPPINSPSGGAASGLSNSGLPGSPEREFALQSLTTPTATSGASSRQRMSREVAAAVAPNSDQRCFDGRELCELVRVPLEDYQDIPRIQRMLTFMLARNATETSKAEALMQIREASIHNPLFSLTPALVEAVKEQLFSRNRMLRPAAAYALAGYGANSRYGRGLMTVGAPELLPRLNAMLRCKVDSMDARYASLAVLTASMHSGNREVVGHSGTIPLLIALIRQNVGKNPTNLPPPSDRSITQLIGELASDSNSPNISIDGERPDSAAVPLPTAGPRAAHPLSSTISASIPASALHPHGHHHHHHHHHQNPADNQSADGGTAYRPYAWGSSDGAIGGAAAPHPWSAGDGTAVTPRMFASEGALRGTYALVVAPAAAHAAAALVNLAELPANRQRMRDAGISSLIEDVLASRNDNTIKERFRLLVEFMHMDTNRFRRASAATELNTTASVSHAVVNFVHRGREAKAAAAAASAAAAVAAAASAAAEHSRIAAFGAPGLHPIGSLSTLGGTTLKGSLTWALAQQLERGDQEDDRMARSRAMKERLGRSAVSRSHSRSQASATAVGRTQSRRAVIAHAGAGAAAGESAAAVATSTSGLQPPSVSGSAVGIVVAA